ncbi:unnamed protein product [Orchesella dallaii]|uniref:C2H2-type domain-containing protein n=1 Tax=Orchesella dallaii TaxID=48710 RepID=A0ABP1Q4I4_9HEXA
MARPADESNNDQDEQIIVPIESNNDQDEQIVPIESNNDQDEQIIVPIESIPYIIELQDYLSNVAAEVEVETTIECEDAVALSGNRMNTPQIDASFDCALSTMEGNQVPDPKILQELSSQFLQSTTTQPIQSAFTQPGHSTSSQPEQLTAIQPVQSTSSTTSQPVQWGTFHPEKLSLEQRLQSLSTQFLQPGPNQPVKMVPTPPIQSTSSCIGQKLITTQAEQSTTSQVLPSTSAQFQRPIAPQVQQQPTMSTHLTQSNDSSDLEILGEYEVNPPGTEYSTEEEYSDELDEVEMRRNRSTSTIQDTLKNIMETVSKTEKVKTPAGKSVPSTPRLQPPSSANISENASTRTSCIQYIGKQDQKQAQNAGLGLNLTVQRTANRSNVTRPSSLHASKLKRNNPRSHLNNKFVRSEGLNSRGLKNETKNVQKLETIQHGNHACSTSTSALTPPFSTPVSVSTPVNQSIGEIQRSLEAPFNPIHPTCWHPCCVFMRELLIRLPWWKNHFQLEELLNIYYTYCQQQLPLLFLDPPESEWIVAKVYQVDKKDGTLRYKCKNCEGVVEQRSSKRRRQLNCGRMKYECDQCHRKYITKKQLNAHLIRHNKKTLACMYCDKLFLTRVELQNHLNTHTGAKPFCCPICFQKFSHSSRYYSHIRSLHKRYDCESCYYKVCATTKQPVGY